MTSLDIREARIEQRRRAAQPAAWESTLDAISAMDMQLTRLSAALTLMEQFA